MVVQGRSTEAKSRVVLALYQPFQVRNTEPTKDFGAADRLLVYQRVSATSGVDVIPCLDEIASDLIHIGADHFGRGDDRPVKGSDEHGNGSSINGP